MYFSIIVPVYNAEKFIRRCVRSIQAQTFTDWELILVDDYSTDHSYSEIKNIIGTDNRIRLITHSQNRGPMVARYTGYKMSVGEYLLFADADDTIPEDTLLKYFMEAEASDSDIISGHYRYIQLNGEIIPHYTSLSSDNQPKSIYKMMLEYKYPHNLCNKVIKKTLIEKSNVLVIEKATNAEDAFFFYQVLQNAKRITHIDSFVYNYYQNECSTCSSRISLNGMKNILHFLSYIRNHISSLYPDLKEQINYYITNTLVEKFWNGYEKDLDFELLIRKYDLEHYIRPGFMFCHYGLYKTMRFLKRRLIHK